MGDYLTVSSETNTSLLYSREDVLSVSKDAGVVNQILFQGRSYAGSSLENYRIVNHDDVVYTKSPLRENPYGIIKTNLGNSGIVSTLYAVYSPKQSLYSPFLNSYFASAIRVNNYLRPLVNKGAKNDMKVRNAHVLTGAVSCPSIQEQRRISDFFSTLDSLIAAAERQEALLRQKKQAFLQIMFPRECETEPRLRFAGFSGQWQQRQLGEVGLTYPGLSGKTKKDFGHGDARFVTYMNVYSNAVANPDGVEAIEKDDRQHEVMNGDVFFTSSSETPDEVGLSSVWLGNSTDTYLNSFCFGYRPSKQLDPLFLASSLRSPQMRSRIVLLAQGISRFNISKTQVMQLPLCFPSLPEQRRIGDFFSTLDSLIVVAEKRTASLCALKSAYLQRMFV